MPRLTSYLKRRRRSSLPLDHKWESDSDSGGDDDNDWFDNWRKKPRRSFPSASVMLESDLSAFPGLCAHVPRVLI